MPVAGPVTTTHHEEESALRARITWASTDQPSRLSQLTRTTADANAVTQPGNGSR